MSKYKPDNPHFFYQFLTQFFVKMALSDKATVPYKYTTSDSKFYLEKSLKKSYSNFSFEEKLKLYSYKLIF